VLQHVLFHLKDPFVGGQGGPSFPVVVVMVVVIMGMAVVVPVVVVMGMTVVVVMVVMSVVVSMRMGMDMSFFPMGGVEDPNASFFAAATASSAHSNSF
jgi:hypothetical protein